MTCNFTKPDGTKCEAQAMKGGELCFTHNPETREQHAIAVRNGGLNRRLSQAYGEEVKLETPEDIKTFIGKVINGVWQGTIPSATPANSLGFLTRCFLDAHEASEVEKRLDKLEERLNKANL